MAGFLRVPDSEEFSKLVELYEREYKDLDSVYIAVLQKFKKRRQSNSDHYNVDSILRSYLLKWGRMGRVLGFKGCKRIRDKLGEMDFELSKLCKEDLSTTELDTISKKIGNLHDEIMNAKWKSEKGKTKRVGPTSASKVLHLTASNLFMMWDRKIRDHYGFKESGEEYVRFLYSMKNWLRQLKPTIERLQNRYNKSCIKIIDEYNWIKCRT